MKNAAPIHHNRLPGHKVAVGRSEKQERAHQIVGRLQPFDRAFFKLQVRQRLRRVLPFMFHQTRRNRVHTDTVAADFPRERAGHADQRRFGSDVMQKVRRAPVGGRRRILVFAAFLPSLGDDALGKERPLIFTA